MKNYVQPGDVLELPVDSGVVSGAPVIVGGISGVAALDRDSVTGKAPVHTRGVFDVSVKAINDSGNVTVGVGDVIHFVSGDTPQLSRKAIAGAPYGVALGAIASGETKTIPVAVFGKIPRSLGPQVAHIADAAACGGTYSQAEVNALKDKINAILAALETAKVLAAS